MERDLVEIDKLKAGINKIQIMRFTKYNRGVINVSDLLSSHLSQCQLGRDGSEPMQQ